MADTVPEDVRKLAEAFVREGWPESDWAELEGLLLGVIDLILRDRSTRPTGREDVIEECARVADAVAEDDGERAARGFRTIEEGVARNTARNIAKAIRSLSSTPPSREWRTIDSAPTRKGIYFASKVVHARRWRLLRDKIGYPIISTWIDEAEQGQSQDLADLWRRCVAEASSAEVLVFNAEPGELFKGAWIELGAALSSGVPVLGVGLDKIEGLTVAHDPRIRHFHSMADVTRYLKPMVSGVPFSALPTPPVEGAV